MSNQCDCVRAEVLSRIDIGGVCCLIPIKVSARPARTLLSRFNGVERRSVKSIMDVKLQRRAAILSGAAAFAQLPARTIGRLAANATELTFKRASMVFARGSPAIGMHVLASGQLMLSIPTPMGTEHVIELIQKGDTFGEAAVLTQHPHRVTASAVTVCEILCIDRQTLAAEIEHDASFAQKMIVLLGEKLYRQSVELESMLFLRAAGRVARFILDRLTIGDAKSLTGSVQLALPVRKGLIASHLNMTQEHFSRTLHELSNTGIIRVDGVNVEVIDIEKLRDTAGALRAEKPLKRQIDAYRQSLRSTHPTN